MTAEPGYDWAVIHDPDVAGIRGPSPEEMAADRERSEAAALARMRALPVARPERTEGTLPPDETAALLASAELRTAEVNGWPEPEDRGHAVLSLVRSRALVEDLITAGRIIAVSGEEGTGKSFLMAETGIRIAAGEGAVAGTWPVMRNGAVLVLSEMHPDDDFEREETVLASLGLARADIRGRYFRLPLMTAAGETPALMSAEWRAWVCAWMRAHGVVLLIIDTATGATLIKPWGEEIQGVYRNLRLMIEECPDLAIALLLHMRKPTGKGGDRGISAVLGEWGRWCDVVLMMENDGTSLERVKLTSRKRVRRERRIIATKRDGLLVEPVDADAPAGVKVPTAMVLAAVESRPGLTYAELGEALGVSKATAARYVKACGDQLDTVKGTARSGPGASARIFIASSHHIASQEGDAMGAAMGGVHRVIASPPLTGGDADVTRYDAGGDDASPRIACQDYAAHQSHHRRTPDGWVCDRCVEVAA